MLLNPIFGGEIKPLWLIDWKYYIIKNSRLIQPDTTLHTYKVIAAKNTIEIGGLFLLCSLFCSEMAGAQDWHLTSIQCSFETPIAILSTWLGCEILKAVPSFKSETQCVSTKDYRPSTSICKAQITQSDSDWNSLETHSLTCYHWPRLTLGDLSLLSFFRSISQVGKRTRPAGQRALTAG